MLKRFLTLALIGLVINLACATSVPATTAAEKETRFAEKVKAHISQLGIGPQARIEVKLRDNTKLKGYVSEIGEQYFVITNPATGAATPVPYPQVKQAKGNHLSSTAQGLILLGAIIAVGILVASQTR